MKIFDSKRDAEEETKIYKILVKKFEPLSKKENDSKL